jgi:hypothetical protein
MKGTHLTEDTERIGTIRDTQKNDDKMEMG